MARRLVFLGLGAVFFAALFLATGREAAVECEVCLEFGGRSVCRTGSGFDRGSARRGAAAAACAELSSGVTQGMECDRTPPRSVRCTE